MLHFGVVLREERYLERKFGDDYRAYKANACRATASSCEPCHLP